MIGDHCNENILQFVRWNILHQSDSMCIDREFGGSWIRHCISLLWEVKNLGVLLPSSIVSQIFWACSEWPFILKLACAIQTWTEVARVGPLRRLGARSQTRPGHNRNRVFRCHKWHHQWNCCNQKEFPSWILAKHNRLCCVNHGFTACPRPPSVHVTRRTPTVCPRPTSVHVTRLTSVSVVL